MIEAVMFWNEPNNKSHWNAEEHDPDWRVFSDMVRLAAEAVRVENSALPRVLGGISPIDPAFMRRMADHGTLAALDAVAVHGFPLDWNHWQLDRWPEMLAEIQRVVDLPVWVSEVGVSTFGAEEVQDFGLARTAELLSGRAPRIHWYSLYDLPSQWEATTRHREAEGSSYYRHFYMGLLREDGTPKLAARRFHEHTPELGICQWFHFDDHRLDDAVRWLRRLGVTYVRTGLSWADWCRNGSPRWFDRLMRALDEFDVTVTFCFTPEHLGVEPHHTSPPRSIEPYADFCAEMVRRYVPGRTAAAFDPRLLDGVAAAAPAGDARRVHRAPSSATAGDVGVLTFHRCINYGSYWQTRCLVDGLRGRGLDPVVLDHDSTRVNTAEWATALRPTLPAEVPESDPPLYREKVRKFQAATSTLPLSPRFDLADPAPLGAYDVALVGSDEVWNLWHPWYGAWPLFFGHGLRARHLASYAASFGNYEAVDGLPPQWAALLGRFDDISVRDHNSRALVAAALRREPELVLDPCLQFPPSPRGEWTGPDGPYVAVYGHNFTERFRREVSRWAAERGYALVSVGYRNEWATAQWITAGPDEFAQCVARAAAVATNFFHGCVFALAFGRPFVCEPTDYRSHKVTSLMALLGAEARCVAADTPAEAYDVALESGPDAAVTARLDALRAGSSAYLDRVFG